MTQVSFRSLLCSFHRCRFAAHPKVVARVVWVQWSKDAADCVIVKVLRQCIAYRLDVRTVHATVAFANVLDVHERTKSMFNDETSFLYVLLEFWHRILVDVIGGMPHSVVTWR